MKGKWKDGRLGPAGKCGATERLMGRGPGLRSHFCGDCASMEKQAQ